MMSALNTAVSGLRATQAGIELVSQNVANADSAGYTRRRLTTVQSLAGDRTAGVRTGAIERVLDRVAQKQLRLETSGAAYTSLSARVASDLDRLFGAPGSANALDTTVNGFTAALQTLLADPGSYSARSEVLGAGTTLAQRIAGIAEGVQALRTEAESRIGAAVSRVNELLSGIEEVNTRIVASHATGGSAALLDERDRMIDELAAFVDVQTTPGENGSVTLTTTAGLTLFNGIAATKLTFDGRGNLGPNALYSRNDAERGVGTVRAVSGSGGAIDVVANGLIRSGEIAAALELRDRVLPQAQRQLDELAAGLSRALSDRPAPVAAVAGGFDIDLTGLQAGNAVTLDYTVGGVPRRAILLPTNGAAPATIPPAATSDPGATVIRVDISGGINGATATAVSAALTANGIAVAAASPAAGTLRFTTAAAGTVVSGVSAGITVTGLASGRPELPFFVDGGYGNTPFTGSFEGTSHLTGFAQRMAVNPALTADRARLVVFNTAPATPQGDTTRPQHLVDSLTKASRTFSAASGIGGVSAPYTSTVADFASRVVETQGANAGSAALLDEGQQVALSAMESRFAEEAGVNVDEEMAQLVALQTAYGANARVMSAVRDMMDVLLRM